MVGGIFFAVWPEALPASCAATSRAELMDIKAAQVARLREREAQVVATLAYVEEQKREVEQNTEWKDAMTRQKRQELLDELNRWYATAIEQVQKALGRISDGQYGFCGACNTLLEPEWLDACPESEFCPACAELREEAA
jgi:DnaK suppressor protein